MRLYDEFDINKLLTRLGFKVKVETHDGDHFKVALWSSDPLSPNALIYIFIDSHSMSFSNNDVLCITLQQILANKIGFDRSEKSFSIGRNPDDPNKPKYKPTHFKRIDIWDDDIG